jgi:ankyrin repeat protein
MEDENDENRPEAQAVDLLEDLDFFLRNQHHPSGKTPSAEVCSDCARSKSQLLRATSNGHIGCVEAALAENRSVSSCRTPQGATAAHIAAKRGDSNILMKLTEADPTCVSARDTRGTTPTHVSAYNGKYGCLRVLVQSAGSANEKAQDGATPLHLAAATGHMDCLEYLVTDAGGMVDNCTNSGATPVYFAAQEGHLDCLQWLVSVAKADPNIPSTDGMTPLHAACQTGHLNCTHWLVRSAACSLKCRTEDGATPVHFAAARGHVAILQWMLHHKLADGSERDEFGATPVHDAAEQNQLESLRVFQMHSTDMHPVDEDGCTPRDLADQRGHTACSELLQAVPKGLRRKQSMRTVEQVRSYTFCIRRATQYTQMHAAE